MSDGVQDAVSSHFSSQLCDFVNFQHVFFFHCVLLIIIKQTRQNNIVSLLYLKYDNLDPLPIISLIFETDMGSIHCHEHFV